MAESERARTLEQRNLYQELMDWRDRQRYDRAHAVRAVRFRDVPWELNPQGWTKWYMHPMIDDTWIKSYVIYLQRIPAGSRSGRQRHPGNMLFYVWKGRGHTVLDGAQHAWEPHDLIQLPLRRDGVVFQHFNDADEDVYLVACEPNCYDALGVDRGSGYEQLEPCPEFVSQRG